MSFDKFLEDPNKELLEGARKGNLYQISLALANGANPTDGLLMAFKSKQNNAMEELLRSRGVFDSEWLRQPRNLEAASSHCLATLIRYGIDIKKLTLEKSNIPVVRFISYIGLISGDLDTFLMGFALGGDLRPEKIECVAGLFKKSSRMPKDLPLNTFLKVADVAVIVLECGDVEYDAVDKILRNEEYFDSLNLFRKWRNREFVTMTERELSDYEADFFS